MEFGLYSGRVRVALVSPYSYTYPGGVGRHVEALAQELTGLGHEVRLLAPYDPDDRLARVSHRGASPQRRPLPDHVVPLGRTLGLPMNGAVSNLATFPQTVGVLSRELRFGDYDVVHVHEPNAPYVSWYATEAARWTAQRFYGGRYRVVPNGVDLSAARPDDSRPHDQVRILFVGRAEER